MSKTKSWIWHRWLIAVIRWMNRWWNTGSGSWRRIDHVFVDVWLVFLQENPPYSKGAFRIEINFPAEYPFKPPKICFKTKIYHPNIDEKGQVCLPIISAENWKPATKTDQGLFIPLSSVLMATASRTNCQTIVVSLQWYKHWLHWLMIPNRNIRCALIWQKNIWRITKNSSKMLRNSPRNTAKKDQMIIRGNFLVVTRRSWNIHFKTIPINQSTTLTSTTNNKRISHLKTITTTTANSNGPTATAV